MHKTKIAPISAILLLFLYSSLYSSEKPWYHTITTQHPSAYSLAGTFTVLCAATFFYYYHRNIPHAEYVIEECRKSYKTIAQDIRRYYDFYHADAQMSDWDLKTIILEYHAKPYPFMTYYKSLIKDLYHLHNHLVTLNKKLQEIGHCKQKIHNSKHSEQTDYLKEMLFQLKIKGKQLQIKTIETITLIIILKNRLKLFKEYNDDCLNWSQITQRIKTISP
ncbi:MAG TPA: hypothetical protein VKU36_00440 [Candidatus Babeliales bacterium]|nr:hypothetical protein [Candidatus Babeliales bacterium]